MIQKFFKELTTGFRWVIVALLVLAILVSLWIACAWGLGWAIHRFFDMSTYGPKNFISFGSCALIFTIIIQAITVILVGWVMLAWGRANGLIGKKQ
jgi:hypothetical protein